MGIPTFQFQQMQERLARNAKRHNETDNLPSCPKPKPPVPVQPVATPRGESANPKRLHVRVTSFRRRLLDPDNLCPKYFIDCLRYAGLIADDTSKQITLTVAQELAAKGEERTEIEIC